MDSDRSYETTMGQHGRAHMTVKGDDLERYIVYSIANTRHYVH